jgi:hypothetical protein
MSHFFFKRFMLTMKLLENHKPSTTYCTIQRKILEICNEYQRKGLKNSGDACCKTFKKIVYIYCNTLQAYCKTFKKHSIFLPLSQSSNIYNLIIFQKTLDFSNLFDIKALFSRLSHLLTFYNFSMILIRISIN